MSPEEYELSVLELLQSQLEKDWPEANARMFHRRRYLGKSGQHHEIDVSAEFTIAGVNVIFAVECKRYRDRVGVEDVLTLATRVEDISAHKGIVTTTIGFQSGAYKIAESKGIALVTLPETNKEWNVLLRSAPLAAQPLASSLTRSEADGDKAARDLGLAERTGEPIKTGPRRSVLGFYTCPRCSGRYLRPYCAECGVAL